MKFQGHPGIASCWIFIQLVVYTSFIAKTEQADSDIWRRPAISLVKGGYEDIVVAIHDSVEHKEYDDLTDKIKEVMTDASRHLYTATKKFFRKVSILIPSSWNVSEYRAQYQVKLASNQESYHKSHIRIRSYDDSNSPSYDDSNSPSYDDSNSPSYDDSNSSSYDYSSSSSYDYSSSTSYDDSNKPDCEEPYVLQPGGCGEESIFIGVTPEFFLITPCWGTPEKALVHLWGHFRWGLFDEYHHSPFSCLIEPEDKQRGSLCTSSVGTKYTFVEQADGLYRTEMTLEEVCSDFIYYEEKVIITVPQNVSGSIMSVGAHDQIDQFCDTDSQNQASLHNADADNRQNRMCRGQSSWEVMRQHLDFSNNEIFDFEEPQFTLMVKKNQQMFVLMLHGEIMFQSRNIPTVINSNERYILQSLALRESSERIGIFLNETHYFTVDLNFTIDTHAKLIEDPNIEISEILIFENVTDDHVNRIFESSLNQNVGKFTFIGSDVRNFTQCQTNGTICKYSTLSEYLGNIHYDDIETFVRVFSEKGTIPETAQKRNFTFTLEKGSPDYFPTLRLSWDKGNLSLSGLDIISPEFIDRAEKLIEMRFKVVEGEGTSSASVTVTLEKRGDEKVNYEVEVFLKQTPEAVIVYPFLKSSTVTLDDVSNVTIYTSVMKKGKPILQADVSARLCPPEGNCTEKTLKDSLEDEEFEDGIGLYSAVFNEFSMSGNYSITVKAKGKIGKAKWNDKGLQPSGILPEEIDTWRLFANPIVLGQEESFERPFERSPREIILEVYNNEETLLTTNIPSTEPTEDICSGDTQWACIVVPVAGGIPVLVLIVYLLLKQLFRLWKRLEHPLEEREMGVLGTQTNAVAPTQRIYDVEMQNNASDHH